MKSMLRGLLSLLFMLSLLLSIALGALWLRSCWRSDLADWLSNRNFGPNPGANSDDSPPPPRTSLHLATAGGYFRVEWERGEVIRAEREKMHRGLWLHEMARDDGLTLNRTCVENEGGSLHAWWFAGVSFADVDTGSHRRCTGVSAPFIYPFVLALSLPVIVVLRRRRCSISPRVVLTSTMWAFRLALSLLLCVLWWRSYGINEDAYWLQEERPTPAGDLSDEPVVLNRPNRSVHCRIAQGDFEVRFSSGEHLEAEDSNGPAGIWLHSFPIPPAPPPPAGGAAGLFGAWTPTPIAKRDSSFAGAGVSVEAWANSDVVEVSFPVAYPLALLLLIPIIRLSQQLRRLSRLRSGLCPACGYDLRASPLRCPECGLDTGKAAVVAGGR